MTEEKKERRRKKAEAAYRKSMAAMGLEVRSIDPLSKSSYLTASRVIKRKRGFFFLRKGAEEDEILQTFVFMGDYPDATFMTEKNLSEEKRVGY